MSRGAFGFGNPIVTSTEANPGTSISSGALLSEVLIGDFQYEVRYIIGGSTNIIWRLQQCVSSGLGSTAIVDEAVVFTPANQSGEYILNYDRIPRSLQAASGAALGGLSTGMRVRVLASTGVTAQYGIKITVEPIV